MKNILYKIFKVLRNLSFTLILIIIAISLIDYFISPKAQTVNYTQFIQQVEQQNIQQVIIVENNAYGKLVDGKSVLTSIPNKSDLIKNLQEKKINFRFEQPAPPPWWRTLLPSK